MMNDIKNRARCAQKYVAILLAACAALLLASCPPEAKTNAKAAPPQLAISYCGVDGITSLTLVMGETPEKLISNYAVSWTSGDDTTADVAADGTIRLTKPSAANTPVLISATGTGAGGGQTASFELTVLAPLTPPAKPSIAVKTEADLSLIRCRLDATYTLANDITLTKEWTPIGDSNNKFTGTLDGAGNTIKNLVINKPSGDQIALVSENTGTIKDIGVELGAAGITGNSSVGALVAVNGQNGIVHGVVSGTGSVNATSNQPSGVGGLVGKNNGTVIGYTSITVNGASNASNGGIVGYNVGTVKGYATGNVSGFSYTGGIVGQSLGQAVIGYYVGTVQGAVRVGGLVGGMEGPLTGYSRGAVSAAANSIDVGKVVGLAYPTNTTINAYYSGKQGESEFTAPAGGTANNSDKGAITITAATKATDFDKFDFTNDWEFFTGKWPAIKFPAGEKIFDPYRGEDQPIEP